MLKFCALVGLLSTSYALKTVQTGRINRLFDGLKDECTCDDDSQRIDCGYSGIDQSGCEGKGCCWVPINDNPNNYPWCYYPLATTAPSPPTTSGPTTTPGPTTPTTTPGPTKYPDCNPTDCGVFSDNQCSGDVIVTPDNYEERRWYTPPKGSSGYQDSFQSYDKLVAYANVVYTNSIRSTADLEIRATHKDSSVKLTYYFDGVASSSATKSYTEGSIKKPLPIAVKGDDGSSLIMDPVDFVWNAPQVAARKGDYRSGQKGGIVEMFGWPHADIEEECSKLAELGWMGVKVFPPQEQLMSYEPFNNILNPWYFMYQPVSYRLQGRMGSRDDLRDLIQTCRSLGVRVYADAVVNHMTGGGNDMGTHRNPGAGCAEWGAKNSSLAMHPEIDGVEGGSPFYTQSFEYTCSDVTGFPGSQEFPGAAYGPVDFHCERALNSWTSPLDMNAGWLTGLTDLNTERDNVQDRIVAYLTDLIGIGFSGFRLDAAKHIQPDDWVEIFTKFQKNMGGTYPDDFITWLEVLLGGEGDMLMCDPDSGYNYGSYLEDHLKAAGISQNDTDKIKIWNSGYPKEPGLGTCTISSWRSAIQNDDADQQTTGSTSRDMGDQGCVLTINCDPDTHRNFEVKLFENPNGADDNNEDFPIRLLLSSFYWNDNNNGLGVPDGQSNCDLCTTECDPCIGVDYASAYDGFSTGYDDSPYTRTHRDATVAAAMQSWIGFSSSDDFWDIYEDGVDTTLIKETLAKLEKKRQSRK